MTNTSGNCDTFQRQLLPPVYGIEFCVALVGNLFALWLLVTRERKNWHTGVVFACNLAISDILYALTLPFLIVYYSKNKEWIFGEPLCKIERFLFTCNLYASIFFIMCISVNRYLAIVYPFFTRNSIRPKHAKIVSVLVWIAVIVMSCPILAYSGIADKKKKCSTFKDEESNKASFASKKASYRISLAILGCLVPFLVTFASYAGLIRVVLKNKNITLLEKRKVSLIVALVVLLYMISFVPYHILQILKFGDKDKKNCTLRNAFQVSKGLAALNMCVHPLLYVAVFDSIRRVCCSRMSKKSHSTVSTQP